MRHTWQGCPDVNTAEPPGPGTDPGLGFDPVKGR